MRRETIFRLVFALCFVPVALLGFQAAGGEAPQPEPATPADVATALETDQVLPSGEAAGEEIPELIPEPLPMHCHEQCAAEFVICKQACGGNWACVGECGVIYDDCYELACG